MVIDEIEIRYVTLELHTPFETSFGPYTQTHTVIVRLRSGEHVAWGEGPAGGEPFYSAETAGTVFLMMRDHIAPVLLGETIETLEDLHRCIALIRGNRMAKGAIDTAVATMLALERGQSLSAFLGGTREKVACGVSVGIQRDDEGNISVDRVLEAVRRHIDEGFRRIKIKIKPGYDLEPVTEIRKAFGDDLPFQVDANSAYTLDDVDVFRKLDRFGLLLIEQPLAHDDIIDHAKLQSRIETPVCLDESIHTLDDARHAIELGSCRVINIKHTRVGGLYHAKRIHDLCADAGVPVWCGGMLESAVGQCHGIAMASLPNFTLAGDLAPSSRYFHRDLIRPWIEMEDGYMAVPQTPGLGFDVDEDYLEEATTEKVVLR